MAKHVALLRGINVGGRNKVPMAALKALCEEIGWRGVRTYIQSGNLVFEAVGVPERLEKALEEGLQRTFGFAPAVVVRTAADWERIVAANPFAEAAEKAPNHVLVGLAKSPIKPGTDAAIEAKARAGERVVQAGEALWFHYPEGVGRSKLTPTLIDRAAGSAVTARNWTTMLALRDMLRA